MSLIDEIRQAQVRAGEDVVVAHLERTLGGLKTDEKAAGDTDYCAILVELLVAVRRVYDDVGPPGEFGYNTRIGKALKNLYDVFNKALAAKPIPATPVIFPPTPVILLPSPFTDAQLYRLWNNSPQISKDVTSCEGFKRVVRLAEVAHGMEVKP